MLPPPPHTIRAALGLATERFAAELAQPQSYAPSWSDFEWRMARAAAVLHGVTPLLSGTLRWSGPPHWQEFMRRQREHTGLRQRRIAAVLQNMDDGARAQGLAVVALKGAALHALGVYTAGQRPMADIDLLVQEADVERMAQLLASLGYAQTAATWKHRMYEPHVVAPTRGGPKGSAAAFPLGEHEDYPIKVDLHTRIAERLPLQEVSITGHVLTRRAQPGLNDYASTVGLLLHLLLHAAGNMIGHALRLIHLHDIGLLAARMKPGEWASLLDTLGEPQGLWWALPPLELVNRYQPGLVPGNVLSALQSSCPRVLRRLSRRRTLTQWSYSALYVPAFPGLPWCRSLREYQRYVAQRLVPGPEQLASRGIVAAEQWAAHSSWSHMPQGRRMVRWLFTHPPRQAAMYVARAALESP